MLIKAVQSNECGRIHYICKNAKGELKIYSDTEILTINFKKDHFLRDKKAFSLLLRLFSPPFEVQRSDCASLINMQLSCSEYSPALKMHKLYM